MRFYFGFPLGIRNFVVVMISMNTINVLLAAFALTALSSCFTGIESTPRIKASADVANPQPTAEQVFCEQVAAEAPSRWVSGKQWLVADDKIGLIFSASEPGQMPAAGQMLSLSGLRTVPTVTGQDAVEISFADPFGRVYSYPSGLSREEFAKRSELAVPFAIEMQPVEIADSLMRGQTYFIKSPRWYEADGTLIHGLRHVPVTIDSVVAGNAVHPLKVVFHAEGQAQSYSMMMTYGSAANATRNFDVLFSFANPRLDYPMIEDPTWELITRSEVAEGMNREECRLALGTPTSLQRGATTEAHLERWSYGNGVYLIFEDGILTRYRK